MTSENEALRERVANKLDEWIGDHAASQDMADAAIAVILDALWEPSSLILEVADGDRNEALFNWQAMLAAFRDEQGV